jgi:hypothetical protein
VTGATGERRVTVRPATWRDWGWLLRQGLSPELVGRQYHWAETPLQLVIAPLRGAARPGGPRGIVEVDGRRAGWIGRNPVSGNLEYFLVPWARGGVGRRAIAEFLRTGRPGDPPRRFFVSKDNGRSRAALLGAFADLGWREGVEFEVTGGRAGWWISVGPGPAGP